VVQLFRPDNTFWHQKTKTIFFVMKIDGSAIKINGYRYDKDTEQIVPGVQVSPNVIHRDGKDYLVCEDNSFLPVEELQALDNTSLDAIATYNIVVIHYLMLLLKKL
jgi:hypothetical protein